MTRTNIHLANDHLERLRELAERKGVSVAELVRRAIDAYLVEEGKNAGRNPADKGPRGRRR